MASKLASGFAWNDQKTRVEPVEYLDFTSGPKPPDFFVQIMGGDETWRVGHVYKTRTEAVSALVGYHHRQVAKATKALKAATDHRDLMLETQKPYG